MISDVLSQTVDDLDHYLTASDWDGVYSVGLRDRLMRLREEANDIRILLDTEPNSTDEQHATVPEPQDTRSKQRKFLDWLMSDETATLPRFFSQKDVLERGWRKRLIAQLLGEPDWKQDNPHYPGAAPMLCWRQDRVLEIEKTLAFEEFRHKVKR